MSRLVLNLSSSLWQYSGVDKAIALKGGLYIDSCSASPEQLAAYIGPLATGHALSLALQRLNGFYAWVSHSGQRLRAGVDHVRSWPLFYGQSKGNLYLSDDAEWVRTQVGDVEMDPLARDEFLLAGYVTGGDTLYPSVKQLQAGEYLEALETAGTLQVRVERYYRFWHTEPQTYTESELHHELERVTLNAMRRLIEHAAGRQIVIPLSGGYDSRLLISMLRKLDYSNVLCFTYGVRGNKEADYSRQVAKALNFKWTFVEYSVALWRREWHSAEAEAYRQMATNHVSLPHIQDWMAVKHLVASGAIACDAVVVPGHTGDFVAGGHIPGFVFTKTQHTERALLEAVVKTHLCNAPKQGMIFAQDDKLLQRVSTRIAAPFDGTDIGLANLYELWDWQERQAKYIVNSVRVYDQFNLDWWLPLWDLEFIRFWEDVPLTLRKEREWFKTWISKQYFNAAGNPSEIVKLDNASDRTPSYRMLRRVFRLMPLSLQKMIKPMHYRRIYENHFLAFEGLVDPDELTKYLKKRFNIVGMYSDLLLKKRW